MIESDFSSALMADFGFNGAEISEFKAGSLGFLQICDKLSRHSIDSYEPTCGEDEEHDPDCRGSTLLTFERGKGRRWLAAAKKKMMTPPQT